MIRKTMLSFLSIGLLITGSTIGGPCCANSPKACPGAKKCDTSKAAVAAMTIGDSTPAQKTASTAAPAKTILFFMNPNGHPCQMQLAVLDGMKDKLPSLARITYIKTTVSADRDKFSEYGIRGLPSLIIVDKDGKELHRFTPGVQEESTILDALKQE